MAAFGDADVDIVLLLTVDCLRADTARDLETVSGLATSYVDVPDCQCTGSSTYTSMPGLMQSRLPTDAGGRSGPHALVEGVPTLAEVLADAGFTCGGWHANHFTSREFDYHRGFDVFADLTYDPPDRPGDDSRDGGRFDFGRSLISYGRRVSRRFGVEAEAKRVIDWFRNHGLLDRPEAPAETVVDAILGRLRGDGRQFLWGHLMDTHFPYEAPRAYTADLFGSEPTEAEVDELNQMIRRRPQAVTDSEARDLAKLYLGCARYVDDQVGRLVEELRERGRWDETLLVITSDHGEMFGDRTIPDYYPFEHPSYLCDHVTHVPLVFAGGTIPKEAIRHLASGMDVPPTVAAAAGVEVPDAWRGVVLGSPAHAEREHVFSVTGPGSRPTQRNEGSPRSTIHASLRTERAAVLWWSEEDRGSRYYDRHLTHADPRDHEREVDPEAVDGAESYAAILSSTFADHAGCDADDLAEYAEDLSGEQADRLRQLGYIE